MNVYTYSMQGARKYQQDRLLADTTKDLYAVIDGMGGHSNGDKAAQEVVDVLSIYDIKTHQDMVTAFKRADNRVSSHRDDRGAVGTCIRVIKEFEGMRVEGVHAGDTRCYVFSSNGSAQLTKDHTFSMPGSRWHGVITNSFSSQDAILPDEFHIPHIISGDIVLLASDGAWGPYEDLDKLEAIVRDGVKRGDAAEFLCKLAIHDGSTDNATAIVIDFN